MSRSSPPDKETCGSELAREGGGTSNINANRPTAIASKLAPTLERLCPAVPRPAKKPVGASLLAKAAAHPHQCQQTHRYREQARSHRGCAWPGVESRP